jgi:hypothetical protein
MTADQRALLAMVIFELTQMLENTAPGEEQVERLRDYDRTMIGGIYLSISILFGDDAERDVKDAVKALYRKSTGSDPPSIVPRVLADGAKSGVFKNQIYGQLRWTLPEDRE